MTYMNIKYRHQRQRIIYTRLNLKLIQFDYALIQNDAKFKIDLIYIYDFINVRLVMVEYGWNIGWKFQKLVKLLTFY